MSESMFQYARREGEMEITFFFVYVCICVYKCVCVCLCVCVCVCVHFTDVGRRGGREGVKYRRRNGEREGEMVGGR